MTKELGTSKIIVENLYDRYEFTTSRAAIGSNTGGADHFLSTGGLHNMKKTPLPAVPAAHNPTRYDIPELRFTPVSPEQTAMIAAAKAQERATLNAARMIEKAQEQAEALINDADHVLNSAIQAYLHTGKTTTEVARVLDGAGIYYNEVRGENVATLNTEDLYLLDATELLTVG